MPYRTMDDLIDGVVITFTDITAAKTLEAELRGENAKLKGREGFYRGGMEWQRRGQRLPGRPTSANGRKRLRDQTPAGNPETGGPPQLVHELQVHQVELEMQNAELRRAQKELEALLEQYTDLYDFAPARATSPSTAAPPSSPST